MCWRMLKCAYSWQMVNRNCWRKFHDTATCVEWWPTTRRPSTKVPCTNYRLAIAERFHSTHGRAVSLCFLSSLSLKSKATVKPKTKMLKERNLLPPRLFHEIQAWQLRFRRKYHRSFWLIRNHMFAVFLWNNSHKKIFIILTPPRRLRGCRHRSWGWTWGAEIFIVTCVEGGMRLLPSPKPYDKQIQIWNSNSWF